jgi:threonyl-tRNA synthetase
MVFWHPRGWTVYRIIENYIRDLLRGNDYQEIRTPQVLDRTLWEKSGHWDKFAAGMFTTSVENRDYAVKPMNCPGHVQVFNQGLKSYRDLPLRLAEFGSCHRNEPSGTLHGLMRLRGFVQDDAHIFCTENQIQSEVAAFIELLFGVYADFGFTDIQVKLSTRPANRVGDDAVWDKAEHALEQALNARGLPWQLQPGEGAFYGPKIEFSLKDSIGRVWQCGTIQVDFSMPGRLGATYIAEDSSKQVPVMLHRAILGSLERFIAILCEHNNGKWDFWLSPRQLKLIPISKSHIDFTQQLLNTLILQGFAVEMDSSSDNLDKKIRHAQMQAFNYIGVIGQKELQNNTVALRRRDESEPFGTLPIADLIKLLQDQSKAPKSKRRLEMEGKALQV